MPIVGGGCLCGAVRYEVSSQPERVTICHCRFCQRSTGGAYLVEPIFNLENFAVTSGVAAVFQHTSEGSGKTVYVHFCTKCGTKLFLKFERFAGVVGVYGGTFDDPGWFDITAENARHIFLSSARRGTLIPAGVRTFRNHATTSDGAPAEATVFLEPTVLT
ncbi:MAG: GFA family protein [Micropepsaceae bacterium]